MARSNRTVLAAFIAMLIACASAQIMAPTRNYDVTSPVENGPYVVDQILPCTYRLFSDVDSSSLSLSILLQPLQDTPTPSAVPSTSPAGNATATNTTATSIFPLVIAQDADVSKTDASIKHDGNSTYYEHSINFKIPESVTPGQYKVIFRDASTNTELPIPIEIRAAAPSSAASGPGALASGGSSNGALNGKDGGPESIFATNSANTSSSPLYYSVILLASVLLFLNPFL